MTVMELSPQAVFEDMSWALTEIEVALDKTITGVGALRCSYVHRAVFEVEEFPVIHGSSTGISDSG